LAPETGIMKSERLKKLESELEDLEQWMTLGLVPKKDIEKHKEEICSLKTRIDEEKERLRFLKENGELEEYVTPKRSPARQAYAEPHTLPDAEGGENMTDAGLDMETEAYDMETVTEEETEASGGTEEENTLIDEEDEDPFSDRNRWKRGIMDDPDRDNW
jgi:poly-D-alanine transfer protein DltD